VRRKRKAAPAPRQQPVRVELSDDARFAAAVRRVVSERRLSGDPFYVAR
jgi:hypothetical protein